MSQKLIGTGLSLIGAIISAAGYAPLGMAIMAVGGVLAGTAKMHIDQKPAHDPGYQYNTRSSRQPLPLIYGAQTVGVNKTFYHVQKQHLNVICEIGEGEIAGIEREDGTVYEDVDDWLPSENAPLVYLEGRLWTKYPAGLVAMKLYRGTNSQPVCGALKVASDEKWNDALRYTAYLYVRLEYDRQAFATGEPEVTVRVHGLKLAYPAFGWSDNAALCAHDHLVRSSQRGGMGFPADLVAAEELSDAVDYCAARGWKCNLTINVQQAAADNNRLITVLFRGDWIYTGGKLRLRYRDLSYETPVMDLTEDDIIANAGKSSLAVRQPDITERPSAVRATYRPKLRRGKVDDFVLAPKSIVETDGEIRELSLTLVGFDSVRDVRRMSNYYLERERLNRQAICTVRERGAALEPLDLVRITHSMPGWENFLMRVLAVSISGQNTVSLHLIEEDEIFYDDVFNITDEAWDDTTLLDPHEEPPDVINAALEEEQYHFRGRAFTRLNCTFSPPANYPWFDHVQVWVRIGTTGAYRHQFNAAESFTIDPVEENQAYYVRLRTVNVLGRVQSDANAVLLSTSVVGRSATVPKSLTSITAIVTNGALNVYGERVDDPDVELYEFRLGAAWAGAVYLAANRAPVYSIGGVKPGSHTIWANTLATNGLYGATPRSASVVIDEPPDGWSVVSTQGPPVNLITNPDMELDSDWTSVGSPTVNERSTTQKKTGTYSRKFTVDAAREGIRCADFQSYSGVEYSWSAWVYPVNGTSVTSRVRLGDNSGWLDDVPHTGLTQGAWNLIYGSFTPTASGSQTFIQFFSPDGVTSGTWYVDDVCLLRGAVENACAYLYNGEAYIRCTHASGLTGTWTGPVYDLTTSARRLVYVLCDIVVISGAGSWAGILPAAGTTWADAIGSRSWSDIFAPQAAPQMNWTLKFGDATPPTSGRSKMEIICCIVTGRYFRAICSITDPNPETYGMLQSPTLKFCT
jgi:hypothetical protein